MANDGANRTKLGRWLRPLLFPFDTDEQERADKLVIRHVNVNDNVKDVGAVKVPIDLEEKDIDGIALKLETLMVDDAEGIGGLQRYQVQAFVKKTPCGRLSLRYRATFDADDDGVVGSEPATEKGFLSQMMRHVEAKDRMFNLGYGQLLEIQMRTIDTLTRQNETLLGKHMEGLVIYEELVSQKHTRDLETNEANAKLDRNDQLLKKFLMIAPTIAKKLGLPVNDPDAMNPTVDEFRSILQSLDDKQLEAMSSILRPEQMMAVASMMEDDIKTASEERAKKTALTVVKGKRK